MAKRNRDRFISHPGGYTLDGSTKTNHTTSFTGISQSISSDLPPKAKIVLWKEPITRSFYPRLNEVELRKTEVTSTPLFQRFWLYADKRWLEYYEPAGISTLMWLQGYQTFLPPVPTQSMKDQALTMALSRVASSPFEGAVDLGEINETLRFMKDPLRGVGELFSRMHRKVDKRIGTKSNPVSSWWKDDRRAKRLVRNGVRVEMEKRQHVSEILADTWLEGRYAVMPLIYSACGLAEAAATSVTDLVQNVHSARGTKKTVTTTVVDKNADWLVDGINNFRRKTKVVETDTNAACYVIRYIYYPWMIDAINLARYGISPTQVLSTTWELIPLSFVGDWFVNLGMWLKAMEPKPQCKILDVAYSHKFERICHVEDAGGAYSYYSNLPRVEGVNADFSLLYLKRTNVTNNLQAPTPRMRKQMLTMAQTLDAIALLSRPIEKFFGRFAKFL